MKTALLIIPLFLLCCNTDTCVTCYNQEDEIIVIECFDTHRGANLASHELSEQYDSTRCLVNKHYKGAYHK